jgi:hypothetical protein
MMKLGLAAIVLVALALSVHGAAVTPFTYQDDPTLLLAVSGRDPVASNLIDRHNKQRERLQQLKDMRENVLHMTDEEREVHAPQPQPYPIMSPHLNRLLVQTRNLRRDIQDNHVHTPGSSPAEHMLYDNLYRDIKSASRALAKDPTPAIPDPAMKGSIAKLTRQISQIGGNLEGKEATEMHQKAHAQSRMLHRMTHALAALGSSLEARKRQNYEGMMGILLQHHLEDPHYQDDSLYDHLLTHYQDDSLYDHLLTNHLTNERNKEDYADHVAHSLLYHRLDQHIGDDADQTTHLARYAALPMAEEVLLRNSRNQYRNEEEGLRSRTLQTQQIRPLTPATPATPAAAPAK